MAAKHLCMFPFYLFPTKTEFKTFWDTEKGNIQTDNSVQNNCMLTDGISKGHNINKKKRKNTSFEGHSSNVIHCFLRGLLSEYASDYI